MCRLQAEEEAKQQTLRLSEQLGEMHKKQEVEVCGTISAMKLQHLWCINFVCTDLSDSWPCVQELMSAGICSA